jgi:hypothetical protein
MKKFFYHGYEVHIFPAADKWCYTVYSEDVMRPILQSSKFNSELDAYHASRRQINELAPYLRKLEQC